MSNTDVYVAMRHFHWYQYKKTLENVYAAHKLPYSSFWEENNIFFLENVQDAHIAQAQQIPFFFI